MTDDQPKPKRKVGRPRSQPENGRLLKVEGVPGMFLHRLGQAAHRARRTKREVVVAALAQYLGLPDPLARPGHEPMPWGYWV